MMPMPGPPYEWDENKSRSNLQARGFGFDLIHHFEWVTADTRQDFRSEIEARWISTGFIGERLYVAVWTLRGIATRIISLRKANDREIDGYERPRD